MKILDATLKDIPTMNGIIIAAKRHWGYSDELIGLWLSGLWVDKSAFDERRFWLLEHQQQIIGVASVSKASATEYELEDCWVLPECMGSGAGKLLFEHVTSWLSQQSATTLRIVADPNAEGFYRHMGARFIKRIPSKPEGRQIPVLEFRL